MKPDDRTDAALDDWIGARRAAAPSAGFADRVISTADARTPRWLPFAAVAAAVAVAALRTAAALAVFVAR